MYNNLFDALLIRDSSDLTVKPGLAESWSSVSDTVWEFKLRQGVKFTNGEPFDANSVKFSFDRIMDPNSKSPWLPFLNVISKVEVVDPSTIHITTTAPYGPLPEVLLSVWMLPPQYYQQVGADKFGTAPIGTGPYKLTEWVKNDHITMVANDDYWRGKPAIANLQWKLVNDPLTRVQALKAGQADIVYQVPPAQINDINASPNVHVIPNPSSRVMVAGFNTFVKPFNDVRVRQALNYAVDKQAIIKNILAGHGVQISSAGSPASFGYDASIDPYPYDPAKAQELLTQAGYPNGFQADWYGTKGRYEADVEIQQAIAGYLEAVGVTTKMTLTDVGTFFNDWLAKKYQGLWFFGQGDPLLDEDYMLNGMLYSKGRGWYYSTPDTDAMIEAARTETDPAKRKALYSTLMQKLHDEAPWIFLWEEVGYYGVSNRLDWKPDTSDDVWLYGASLKTP